METPDKEEYLEQLSNFLESAKLKIKSVLDKLGWDEERTFKGLKDEEEGEEAQGPTAGTSGVPDKGGLSLGGSKAFPGPLYNEILSNLAESGKLETREKTELEKLAEERDAKRRRASYRNKVHTKNKPHTQVLREVIEQQMSLLTGHEEEKVTVSQPAEAEKVELKEYKPSGRDSNPHLEWKQILKNEEKKDLSVSGKSEPRRDSRERERRSFDDSRKDRRYLEKSERDRRDFRDYPRRDYGKGDGRYDNRRRDYERFKYPEPDRLEQTEHKKTRRPERSSDKRERPEYEAHDSKRRRDDEPKHSSQIHDATRSEKRGKKRKKERKKDKKKKRKRRKRSVTSDHARSSSGSD